MNNELVDRVAMAISLYEAQMLLQWGPEMRDYNGAASAAIQASGMVETLEQAEKAMSLFLLILRGSSRALGGGYEIHIEKDTYTAIRVARDAARATLSDTSADHANEM